MYQCHRIFEVLNSTGKLGHISCKNLLQMLSDWLRPRLHGYVFMWKHKGIVVVSPPVHGNDVNDHESANISIRNPKWIDLKTQQNENGTTWKRIRVTEAWYELSVIWIWRQQNLNERKQQINLCNFPYKHSRLKYLHASIFVAVSRSRGEGRKGHLVSIWQRGGHKIPLSWTG